MSALTPNPKRHKYAIFYLVGLLLATAPPIIAIITYFPVWKERSGAAVFSGGALLLVAIACIPLYKFVKEHLRSPSAPLVWLLIYLTFLTVRSIADEMVVISFVGFLSNLLASFFFKAARKRRAGEEN